MRVDHQYFYLLVIRLFKVFLLLCSVLSGILFAIVWRDYKQTVLKISLFNSPISEWSNVQHIKNDWRSKLDSFSENSIDYNQWLSINGLESVPIRREDLSYRSNESPELPTLESEFLANQTSITCMILSTTRHRSRALNNTWTKHCNHRWFYGGHHENKIPYVKLRLLDESILSPRAFCLAFIDIINRIEESIEWLLITTDQTFAIVENLRYYVTPLDSGQQFYIGRPVHHYFLGVYNAIDSGIVLSKATVQLLANTIFYNRSNCNSLPMNKFIYGGQFDSYIGMHLASHRIRPANSFDDRVGTGGSRFHPFMPERHLNTKMIPIFDSFWSSNVLPVISGINCCSNQAVTFAGFSPVTMYFIEYILYHLSAFNGFDGPRGLGNNLPPYESFSVSSDLENRIDRISTVQQTSRSSLSSKNSRSPHRRKHSKQIRRSHHRDRIKS
ncbi:Glycoprotein-N-acetylgalactosamine 3-beta-galactosyltransferase 1 [Sarcoptes scabiei]|uniref:Glycoprotein-N-acetylgalactosamine 3-beta-galactosyltransferase 1 n=1 Tax=Sarcoptes scabiei TaxID=52283 RepID=A0A834RFC7_SARSC|nr:Glycoprotein-N-acetylgalactosamine 3-beta-galactosyltransferase 1 [Sarcoptes scabiei]